MEITKGDIVVVHHEKKPRGFWSLGKLYLEGMIKLQVQSLEYSLEERNQTQFVAQCKGCIPLRLVDR